MVHCTIKILKISKKQRQKKSKKNIIIKHDGKGYNYKVFKN